MRTFTNCALAAVALCWLGSAAAAPKGGTPPGQLTKQANEAMDRGDYDAAIELYTQAISNNPNAWNSYFHRGAALMRKLQHGQGGQGQGGQGQGHGQGKGKKNELDPRALDPVLNDYDKAVELAGNEPGSAEPLYERGKVHYLRGESDKAKADYDEAVKRDPSLAKRGYYDQ
jgi:tetratricopeptide (TPR) repeat protein